MKRSILIVGAMLLSAGAVRAQISYGGTPISFTQRLSTVVPTQLMPRVDVVALLAEDDFNNRNKLGPYRFGETFSVDLSLDNSGAWESLSNGDRLWRLRISAPNAYTVSALFDKFWLPHGASLFVYNDDHSAVLGEFNELNNETHGMFAIEPIPGDAITLEYYEPYSAPAGLLSISEVIHGYRDIYGIDKSGGSKAAGSCEININCPLGANWQDVKHAVTRVILGGALCSGSMINDTANDGKQYYITANHCYGGNPAQWIFQFNYEATTCAGTTGSSQSVTGCTLRTKSTSGDNCLVEITPTIPSSYNAYLEGWSRVTTAPTAGTGIHHPQGDIKKISTTAHAITTDATVGGSWHVTQWDNGATEPGSSGSPLYDQNQRFVGQLYGGASKCGFPFDDYYGKLAISWNTGVKTYLDAGNTGITFVDGRYLNTQPPQVYCTSKLNSQFCSPAIGYTGSPSASSASAFDITASQELNNKNGLLFYGLQPSGAPFQGGFLCVKAPTKRTSVQSSGGSGSGTDCSGTYSYDFNALIQSGTDASLIAGATIYTQYWSRDPADFSGFGTSLSDALSFKIAP